MVVELAYIVEGAFESVDHLRQRSARHIYTTFAATLDPVGEEHLGNTGKLPTYRTP